MCVHMCMYVYIKICRCSFGVMRVELQIWSCEGHWERPALNCVKGPGSISGNALKLCMETDPPRSNGF